MLYLFRVLRNNLFPIVFLFLFGFSIFQVIRFNTYQESFYFNTSNTFLNSASRVQNSVTSYFNLKEINQSLVEQNKLLLNQASANLIVVDSNKTAKLDSLGIRRYSYIVCNVIKSGTIMRNNFITIDKGSSSGIKIGMAVISASGIAGSVFDVSENFALVLSVLNNRFVATPMIPDLNIRDGSVTWDGSNVEIAQLNNINKFEKLKPGMRVVTSNYSPKFPAGIPIGTIQKINKRSSTSFYDIDIKLATDFRKLGYVFVITDHFTQQLDTLAKKERTETDVIR